MVSHSFNFTNPDQTKSKLDSVDFFVAVKRKAANDLGFFDVKRHGTFQTYAKHFRSTAINTRVII